MVVFIFLLDFQLFILLFICIFYSYCLYKYIKKKVIKITPFNIYLILFKKIKTNNDR